MALPKEIIDRIKADSIKKFPIPSNKKNLLRSWAKLMGYTTGATAEAERAQVLVEALKIISKLFPNVDNAKEMKLIATEALSSYNKTDNG